MKLTGLKLLLLVALLLIKTTGFGQQKLIDSLQKSLNKEHNGSKKALLTAKLAEAIRYINLPKSLSLADDAIALAHLQQDDATTAYVYLACYPVFQKADSITRLLNAADSALLFAQKTEDRVVKGVAHIRKGAAIECCIMMQRRE